MWSRSYILIAMLILPFALSVSKGSASSCWTVSVSAPVRVVDGDTFVADVPIYLDLTARERVRVLGVDTPELHGATVEKALEAKAFTEKWLAAGPVMMEVCARDSFGRVLAKVTRAGENLADVLIGAGLGRKR